MARDPDLAERDDHLLRRWVEGRSLRELADAFDLSVRQVGRIVKREQRKKGKRAFLYMDEIRGQALMALDLAESKLMEGVLAGRAKSIDLLLKLQARRSKLLGLDKPMEIKLSTNGSLDVRAVQASIFVAARDSIDAGYPGRGSEPGHLEAGAAPDVGQRLPPPGNAGAH